MTRTPRPLTRHFAELGTSLRFDDLSEVAVSRAKASILDAIGCMLAGAATEEAAIVRRVAEADGGRPRAQAIGSPSRLPPAAAALVNGTAGHALDYDDSSPPMIGHPSVPLVSAMLALGETFGAGGRSIVTAFVAGLEIAAGLGRRMNPAHYAAGWHATATLGTLGATLAAAGVARLDAAATAHALGIASSSAAGIRKNFGSMAKPLHAGLAARNAVAAVQLARAGVVTDPAALDGDNGFIDVFKGAADYPEWTPDTGAPLEIVASGIGIKRYPCCGCAHSALDAILALRAGSGVLAGNVAAVHCTMNGLVPDILVHHRPKTPAQAKFSMEYCLAVALLDGDCGLDQFTAERVTRGDVQTLLERVETAVDPAIAYRNGVYPGTVTLTLRDGTTLSRHAEEALGHPDRPLSMADLEQKFMACARRALGARQAGAAFDALTRIEDVADIRLLIKHLTPQGEQS